MFTADAIEGTARGKASGSPGAWVSNLLGERTSVAVVETGRNTYIERLGLFDNALLGRCLNTVIRREIV